MYTRYLLGFLLPLVLDVARLGSAQRITSGISSSRSNSLSISSSVNTHSSTNSTIIISSSTQNQTATSRRSPISSSSSSIGTRSSTNLPVIPSSSIPNQSATSSRSPILSSSSVVASRSSDSASSFSSSKEASRPTQPTSSKGPISITAAPAPPSPSKSQSLPPFVAPTVTSTVPISIRFPTPTASSGGGVGGIVVTNPKNPRESVSFGTAKVPTDKRLDLPGDVSDLAPLALLLLGFPFPVLLFSGFTVVFPIAEASVLTTAGTWLALSQFPTPKLLGNDGSGGDGEPSDPEHGEPSQSEAPSRTSKEQSRPTSNPVSLTTSRATSSMSKSSSISSSASSSSASQAKPTQYLIFPKSGHADLVKEFSTNLTRDLGSDKVLNSIDDGALDFWAAIMDPKYADDVKSKTFIEAVEPNVPFTVDDPSSSSNLKDKDKRGHSILPTKTHRSVFAHATNAGGYEDQNPVGPQLGWISHTFASFEKKPDHYFFRPAAGNGIRIYIIDTGVNVNSIAGQTFGAGDFIYGGFYPYEKKTAEDGIGHGTCVAAMAADSFFGVAKRATIVPVKLKTIPQPDNGPGLVQVDSVESDPVLSAYNFTVVVDKTEHPGIIERFRGLIEDIMAEDVPVIVAAGNNAAKTPTINTEPQIFEGPNFPIINVGAVDDDGNEANFSQRGTQLNVHAFGSAVTCRDQHGNQLDNKYGTSFAAPQVAGLAAYFLSLTPADGAEYTQFLNGQTAAQMKAKIISMARRTSFGDVPVIRNGADDFWCGMAKRQEGGPQSACSRCAKCSRSVSAPGPSTLVTLPSSITQASSSFSSIISTTPPGSSASPASDSSSLSSTISTASPRSTVSPIPPSPTSSPSAVPSGILTCQQIIPPGGPAPSDIASAIRGTNDVALEAICAAKFDVPGDLNQMTFNHGSLTINVARTDTSKGLQYCQKSILQILDTCILGTNNYGGISAANGEKYTISNIVWPQNPLIPGTDPGAPTPSTTTPPSRTNPPLPPAQTVTINGAICILLPGSVTPQCRPIETPTPNAAGTNIHVESGCINVNGVPLRAGDKDTEVINIPNQNEPWFTANIYGNFNPDDHTWGNVNPGCELQARWPGNFGDIYFKADNCLYDASGNKIWDECCTSTTTAQVTNPYGRKEIATCDCIGVVILGRCVGIETGDGCGRIHI
ncbi:hypothetical protein DM02DRAFT_730159 [Periconia macrospinosa]|uniref:Peptidase S8/S53 domain-containing protein n=1 Tax=Periconia macrospinosa TaxID=97972 RepID=A0A2V1DK50_9PLEO|nr:hypothetical protein DM02DRAFT_730159 [Periconia macrospinosa]